MFFFTSKEDSQFEEHIVQVGQFNHHLGNSNP